MEEKELKKYYFTQLIVWAALVMSVIIYLLMGIFVLADTVSFDDAPDVTMLRYVFAAISIFVPMINIWIMKRVLGSEKHDSAAGAAALAPYAINNVIMSAISEAVGVFGLVLFLLGGDEFDLYAFCALSLVYMFMFMPKYSGLKNWAIHKELLVGDRAKDPNVRGYRK